LESKWIIVEAKAHVGELKSDCQAKNESLNIINRAFEKTQKRFNISTQNRWSKEYYQLANRLAFINFMLANEIRCSLLNIYFINGWYKDADKNVLDKKTWEEKIDAEYAYLGINENAKEYISEIFVEC
jgi:hypothetical protein